MALRINTDHIVAINRNIMDFEYAVRGLVPMRALELQKEGREMLFCNIGNPAKFENIAQPHVKRIFAAVEHPEWIARLEMAVKTFGGEAELMSPYEERMVGTINGGIKLHAYSESAGAKFVREAVAEFIDRRDGGVNVPHIDDIFLVNGASEGAHFVLAPHITGLQDGVMIPRPQYPFYSAEIVEMGGSIVYYNPDPEQGWNITRDSLEESWINAKAKGVTPKLLVLINPQNPTGANANRESLEDVVAFCADKGIGIILDEVYQENTYGQEWISGGEVIADSGVPAYILHSTSKGAIGSCGKRGGFLAILNAPKVEGAEASFRDIVLKMASKRICPNSSGQVATYLMVSPPQESDGDIFNKYTEGTANTLQLMHEKGKMIEESLKQMNGVEVFGELGAMYIFPKLNLGDRMTDLDYCMGLVENTGLVTVPGSGFGKPDYMRVTFLPRKDQIEGIMPKVIEFHNNLIN